MIPKLFLSFVRDVLKRLGAEFFGMSASERENALSEFDFEASDLLKLNSEHELLESTEEALLALLGKGSLEQKENPLLLAFSKYLRTKVIPICDQIPTHFFISKANEKNQVLEKLFTDNSGFTSLFKIYLKGATNEELNSVFTSILKTSQPETMIVTVQSARECSPELKSQIRSNYGTASFVVFQVNTRLLGGLLVYKEGKIQDTSWLGKVTALRQLTRNM